MWLAQPRPEVGGVADVVPVGGVEEMDDEAPAGTCGVPPLLLAPEILRLVVAATSTRGAPRSRHDVVEHALRLLELPPDLAGPDQLREQPVVAALAADRPATTLLPHHTTPRVSYAGSKSPYASNDPSGTLRALWLSGNRLTGAIPAELGALAELQQLYLGGNDLTGCIPPALDTAEYTDLDTLGLAYCEAETTHSLGVNVRV